MKKIIYIATIAVILVFGGLFFSSIVFKGQEIAPAPSATPANSPSPIATPLPAPPIEFVGPRGNLPANAPKDYGFWSLSVPVPGALSRSGQPLLSGYQWLKEQGWKSVVNLRTDGERGETGDDEKIPGFKKLGLNYLWLPLLDGHPPTEKQAAQFLTFVTDPKNQPVHIHCRGGIGRTGAMTALYRYAVQEWPMEKAIEESRLYQGGISDAQKTWLLKYAVEHAPGEYGK